MTDELQNRIERLESEVARLRAREGVTITFNRYLYSLDTGFGDAIIDCFAVDGVLDVLNFPPDGVDMHFEGRDAIRPLYEPYATRESRISGGHNATNIAIAVADDASAASLTSYFTTTTPVGVQGGRYEGTLRLESDGQWRFVTLAIISAWGWKAQVDKISEPVAIDRSAFGGRPATDI